MTEENKTTKGHRVLQQENEERQTGVVAQPNALQNLLSTPIKSPGTDGGLRSTFLQNEQAYYDNKQQDYTEEAALAGYGSDRRDKLLDLSVLEDPEHDLEHYRANAQSTANKLVNGAAKFVPVMLTTYADGIVGTVVGAYNIAEYVGSSLGSGEKITGAGLLGSFVDNPVSNKLLGIQDYFERVFPNYYTDEERDDKGKFWTHINANMIGDQFIKNLGFTAGAMLSGMTTSALSQSMRVGGKAARNIIRAGAAASAGDDVAEQGLRKMALNGARNADMHKEALAAAKNFRKTGLFDQIAGGVGGAIGEARIEALHAAREFYDPEVQRLNTELAAYVDSIDDILYAENPYWFIGEGDDKQLVVEEGLQRKQQLIDEAMQKFDSRKERLDSEATRVANTVFGLNIPLLAFDNTFEFGKLFGGGFNTLRKQMRHVRRSGDTFRGLGSVGGAIGSGLAVPAVEGFEEINQKVISEGAKEVGEKNMAAFYNDGKDERAIHTLGSWIGSMLQSGSDVYSDPASWQEFAIGALTGSISLYMGKGNWAGGIGATIHDRLEDMRKNQAMAKTLNDYVKGDETKNLVSEWVRNAKYEEEMYDAADVGNKFVYNTAKSKSLINMVSAFHRTGRLADLKEFVDRYSVLSDNDIEEIRTALSEQDGSGITSDSTDAEVRSYVQQRVSDLKSTINAYADAYESIASRAPIDADEEALVEYAFTVAQMNNFDRRFKSIWEGGEDAEGNHKDGVKDRLKKFFDAASYYAVDENLKKLSPEDRQSWAERQLAVAEDHLRGSGILDTAFGLLADSAITSELSKDLERFQAVLNENKSKYKDESLLEDVGDLIQLIAARKSYYRTIADPSRNFFKKFDENKKTDEEVQEKTSEIVASEKAKDIPVRNIQELKRWANDPNIPEPELAERRRLVEKSNNGWPVIAAYKELSATVDNLKKSIKGKDITSRSVRALLDYAFYQEAVTDKQSLYDFKLPEPGSAEFEKILLSVNPILRPTGVSVEQAIKIKDAYDSLLNTSKTSEKPGGSVTATTVATPEPEIKPQKEEGKVPAAATPEPVYTKKTSGKKKDTQAATWKVTEEEQKNPEVADTYADDAEQIRSDENESVSIAEQAGNSSFELPETDTVPRNTDGMVVYEEGAIPEIAVEDAAEHRNAEEPKLTRLRKFHEVALEKLQRQKATGSKVIGAGDYTELYGKLEDGFKYVDEGNLKRGDEIQFSIYPDSFFKHPSPRKKTIFLRAGDTVLQAMRDATTKYDGKDIYGHKELHDAIMSEYREWKKTHNPDTEVFTFSLSSTVWRIRKGRLQFTEDNKAVSSIPGYSEKAPIVFNSAQHGWLPVLNISDKELGDSGIPEYAEPRTQSGFYYLTKNSDGSYIPVRISLQRFEKDSYAGSPESSVYKTVHKKLVDLFNTKDIWDTSTKEKKEESDKKALDAKRAIGKNIYIGDVGFSFGTTESGEQTFRIFGRERDESGESIQKRNGKDALIAILDIPLINAEGVESTPEELATKVIDGIQEKLSPLVQVDMSDPNIAGSTMKSYIQEGLAQANVESFIPVGASFYFNPYDPETKKFVPLKGNTPIQTPSPATSKNSADFKKKEQEAAEKKEAEQRSKKSRTLKDSILDRSKDIRTIADISKYQGLTAESKKQYEALTKALSESSSSLALANAIQEAMNFALDVGVMPKETKALIDKGIQSLKKEGLSIQPLLGTEIEPDTIKRKDAYDVTKTLYLEEYPEAGPVVAKVTVPLIVDDKGNVVQRGEVTAAQGYSPSQQEADDDEFMEDSSFMRVQQAGVHTKKANLVEELAWLDKVLPQIKRENLLQIKEGLINVGRTDEAAYGKVKSRIMTLSNDSVEGVTYHEAFHWVMQYVLSDEEKSAVYKEAAKVYGNKSMKTLEEHLADDFRTWKLTEATSKISLFDSYENGNIFKKIGEFFRRLYQIVVHGPEIMPYIDSIYRSIDRGKYADSGLRTDTGENGIVGTITKKDILKLMQYKNPHLAKYVDFTEGQDGITQFKYVNPSGDELAYQEEAFSEAHIADAVEAIKGMYKQGIGLDMDAGLTSIHYSKEEGFVFTAAIPKALDTASEAVQKFYDILGKTGMNYKYLPQGVKQQLAEDGTDEERYNSWTWAEKDHTLRCIGV